MALETQTAAADMAAAFDNDPFVRGWLEGYAACKAQNSDKKEPIPQ